MDKYHLTMVSVVLLLLFIVYRFWDHYMTVIKYNCKIITPTQFKTGNLFKTGDLVLFKSLQSYHKIFSNSYFSHIGIIIMMDNIPNVLELNTTYELKGATYEGGAKLYQLEDRIKFYTEGAICIKPINRPLDSKRLALLPEILNWAKNVQYTNADYKMWIKESCIDSNIDRYTEPPFDCVKFIANTLNKLHLFNKEDMKLFRDKHCAACLLSEGCNLLNYFEQVTDLLDGYRYGPVYNVCGKLDNLLEENGIKMQKHR